MDIERQKPTSGQLERTLSGRIQTLYCAYLEHQPAEVVCQLFENKVAIVLENSITPPVQLLVKHGKQQLAQQVRSNIKQALEPQLKILIEEVLGVPVIDLLSDAKLESGRTGTIAVLATMPKVADPASIIKVKLEKGSVDDDE